MAESTRWRGALALALGMGLGASAAAAADRVRICFDVDRQSVHRYQDAAGQWHGAAFDLTRLALQRAGLQAEWLPLPWARCLREVTEYASRQQVEMLMFASPSPEREQALWPSAPLHADEGGVWYAKAHLPEGPAWRSRADLKRFTLCGMNGGNFQWLADWGVTGPDFKPLSLQSALLMVQRGHCELFLFARQPVEGAVRLGHLQLPDGLAFEPYPDHASVTQHLMLARGNPAAPALLARLNAALTALHRSGESERIYRRYLPGGTGLKDTGRALQPPLPPPVAPRR